MKQITFLILFLLAGNIVFSQNKHIYFELDSTISSRDTIIFKPKADLHGRIVKIPLKKNIKFSLYIGREKIKKVIKSKYLDTFNTISFLKDGQSNKIQIIKGHSIHTFSLEKEEINSTFWKIEIQCHKRLLDQNSKFKTGSNIFDEAIKIDPDFFFK